MRSTVIVVLACLVPSALAARSPDDPVGRAPRRLSLVMEFGGSLRGPGAGLAVQLRQAGFNHTSPRICFFSLCAGPTAHPTQDRPGVTAGLTASFSISGTVAVGAGYGDAPLGGATGYRADADSGLGDYVLSSWDATMWWVGAFWCPILPCASAAVPAGTS